MLDENNIYTDPSYNKYVYTLNSDGTATLLKFTGTVADVPETVTKGDKPYTVTAIGGSAFATIDSRDNHIDNIYLQSVNLPDTITEIGDSAFYKCKNAAFTSITIPAGVTEIKDDTFGFCTSLQKVVLPMRLTTIGNHAFYECTALTSITLSEAKDLTAIGQGAYLSEAKDLTTIRQGAFASCTQLSKVILPEGLNKVEDGAFAVSGLTDITLPKSLKEVGEFVFASVAPGGIQTVTYTGTKKDWDNLVNSAEFGEQNDQLTTAPNFFCAAYSITPATPTTPPQNPGTNPPQNPDKPNPPQENPDKPNPPASAVEQDDTSAIGYVAAAVTVAFVGWGAYHIGSKVYLKSLLPKDALLPQNRIQLAELLWEDAGRPAPADAAAYTDVDANDTDAQQAARWAVENGLLTLPNTEKPEEFVPYRSVSYAKSARAWNKAQQLKETAAAR